MSEDHSEDAAATGGAISSPAQAASSGPAAMTGSSAAGSSPSQEPDYTPLKKRRLATYNESHEEQERKHDKVKHHFCLLTRLYYYAISLQ